MGGADLLYTSCPYLGSAMSSKTYELPLMCSMLLLCAGNSFALWRLAMREADLEGDAWPGLARYTHRLRDVGSFQNFVLKVALDVIHRDGHVACPEPAPEPAAAAPGAPKAVVSVQTDAELEASLATLANYRSAASRRTWFRSEQGRQFRVYSSPKHRHKPVLLTEQKWCAFSTTEYTADATGAATSRARRASVSALGIEPCIGVRCVGSTCVCLQRAMACETVSCGGTPPTRQCSLRK